MSVGVESDHPIPTVRAIIATHNSRGGAFDLTALKKWMRLCVEIHNAEKIDVLADSEGLDQLGELLAFARTEKIRLSLRTDCAVGPPDLVRLKENGLLDVYLCPASLKSEPAQQWLTACREAGLPMRVQLTAPFESTFDRDACLECLSGVKVVNVSAFDRFSPSTSCGSLAVSEAILQAMNGLVRALDAAGIEANLLSVPFCHVDGANQANAVNEQQFFLDHQHYISSTYELVQDIRRLGSSRMQMTIENLLTRRATLHHLIDNALLPWIMGKPRYYVRVWMLHKLTRHLKFFKRGPRPLPETVSACEAQVEQMRLKRARDLGNECGRCRFQRICDHMPRAFKEAFPGIQPKAIEGETVLSPTHYLQNRKRFYDAVDEPRLHVPDQMIALAKEAYAITLREKATRKVSVSTYELENHFSPVDDAAVRWISYSNVHIESTVLTRLELPFTLSVTFGGGIAQHIGFSFGRHVKIMCPMIDHSHQLIFHVDKTGHFVLLRDGELIRPSEFEEAHRVPPRLAGSLEPRLAVSNVDGLLLSQAIQVWEGEQERLHDVAGVKYSVMIINSRYTRRLQAVLMALAHQVDFDMAKVEVVVCYVPGFDATDDTLDSMELAFPELRIVRSPFSEDLARSKGFMINESLHVASGEWIVLLDADIVVPPDLFAKVDAVEADAKIIAPDGRLMLSPQATARILLGQDHTWENFDGFASGATEYRYREADSIPIGFFQCVRRHILQAIPYQELDHFEGSDYVFGRDSVGNFGKEARLKGVYVLHLDHGGSQWYGTKKHL